MSYGDYKEDYRNPEMERTQEVEYAESVRIFFNRVYNWMGAGLFLSALSAFGTVLLMNESKEAAVAAIRYHTRMPLLWSPTTAILLIVAELALVFILSGAIHKLSVPAAGAMFLVYSVFSGISLAPVCMSYTGAAVSSAFLASAGMFVCLGIYGYTTKRDLSGIGSFAVMLLFGVIIASLLNFFFRSEGFDKLLSYIGVFIFAGLTAWDNQRLKSLVANMSESEVNTPDIKKFAIIGALQLYLDFVNLFLYLLRIFGRRR